VWRNCRETEAYGTVIKEAHERVGLLSLPSIDAGDKGSGMNTRKQRVKDRYAVVTSKRILLNAT
jgi:hypothetical protein